MVTGRIVRAYGLVLLVFLLGVGAGGGGAYAYLQKHYSALLRDPHFSEHRRMHVLSRRLHLDEEQERRVREIFTRYRDEKRRLDRDMIERCGGPLREHRTKMDAEIRAVLRPEQQARFDRFTEERRPQMWLR